MNTTMITKTVEDVVARRLEGLGFLVAKPKFDRDGTDLIALLQLRKSAKFCRIQCKGITLAKLEKNYITIPKKYFSDAFVLFLNIERENKYETNLYCFLKTDIKKWKRTEDIYYLQFNENDFKERLKFNEFNDDTEKLIRQLMKDSEISEEFRRLIYGK
ncbi:MAG: hypothetical protein ACUZ8O_09655 [Candidatus Anammoxibacter sp.]